MVNNNTSAELKALHTKLNEAEDILRQLRNQVAEADNKVRRIKSEIQTIIDSEIVISEHAILRYLERIKGIDMNVIKEEMMPEKVMKQIQILSSGKFPCDTHYLKVKNRVVITVLDKNSGCKICNN